jgi:23S rRNA (uridine2552-2'-O)-methyltransferase
MTMAKRSKSSQRWLARQRRDPYVRDAARDGLSSRAHFKLEQLNQRFKLLRAGMRVLDLGAAPGGWTRHALSAAPGIEVIAVDMRPMEVPAGVTFLELDIHSDSFEPALEQVIGSRGVDLVLCDMAPNISGIRVADQAAAMALVELATLCAERWLNPGGHLVVKMFQGDGTDDWLKQQRTRYRRALFAKPDASRRESKEIYGVALERQQKRRDQQVVGPGAV